MHMYRKVALIWFLVVCANEVCLLFRRLQTEFGFQPKHSLNHSANDTVCIL